MSKTAKELHEDLDHLRALAEALVADVNAHNRGADMDEGLSYPNGHPAKSNPHRWAAIGSTDLQTGLMALERAIDRRKGF